MNSHAMAFNIFATRISVKVNNCGRKKEGSVRTNVFKHSGHWNSEESDAGWRAGVIKRGVGPATGIVVCIESELRRSPRSLDDVVNVSTLSLKNT